MNINAIFPLFSGLNEDLVTLLMERDDLHMEQDSMLVDIEDLTKHMWVSALWGKISFMFLITWHYWINDAPT